MTETKHFNPEMPMISIITVNYNGWQDTCELIDSLKRYETYPSYEVIVVDNASRGDDVSRLRSAHPDVRVVESERNLGFAGGNNLGYRYACGEYIFLLNNDMVIKEPVLGALVKCLKEGYAGVSPTIRYWRDKNSVQYYGCRKLAPITLKYQTETFDDSNPGKFLIAGETEVMHGGAMMVRRDVIEKVGEMTEVYFLFAEEFDWSYRITENGYKLWYDADTVIYHKGGATINYGSPLRAYYMSRARLLFTRRNSNNVGMKFLSCAYLSLLSMPKNVCGALFRKDWRSALALLRGTWHGLVDKKI